jgi:nicotinate phosphoribosyltransferase
MDMETSPLLTDLYELTMLRTYRDQGMDGTAVFEFFVRDAGPRRPFFVSAGIESALDWLVQARFGEAECQWLRECGHFDDAFIDAMAHWHFSGTVRAMREGTIAFPNEPILQVIAPLPEAQLVESRLMNILHGQTLFASKAIRCRLAAGSHMLVDFGLRRAHGGEAGMWAARSCYLAGFDATATCLAGARYGVPVNGTMAHSFILAHEDERQAFLNFARSYPNNAVFLIDTYDVEKGAKHVVEIAPQLHHEGIPVKGVRIDSGDLASHARRVRTILDQADLTETRILVSGGLDEDRIAALVADGAPIDGFGVGSRVDTSDDVPYLDCAYKLHEYDGRAVHKRSEKKNDLPGRKQVFRHYSGNAMNGDIIGVDGEALSGEALLVTRISNGERVDQAEPVRTARSRCEAQLQHLPAGLQRLQPAERYSVTHSSSLQALLESDGGS